MRVPILDRAKVLKWYERTKDSLPALFAFELERNTRDNELYFTDDYIEKLELPEDDELFALCERCLITHLFVSGYLSLDEHSVAGHNWALKLLGWYEGLSESDKKELPVYGNKIGVRGLADYAPRFSTLPKLVDYPGVQAALEIINQKHKESGCLSEDYVPVNKRHLKQENAKPEDDKKLSAEFTRLQELRIAHVSELEPSTDAKPFLCVMHLFAYAASFNAGKTTWRTAMQTYAFFSRFLISIGFTGMEPLLALAGPYSLIRFRAWLEDLIIVGDISPSYANSIISKTRITFKTLDSISGVEGFSFYDVEGFDPERVTDLYRPYTPGERERIAQVVDGDIESYNSLTKTAEISGVGVDPFLEDQSQLRRGSVTLENMRWVFENRLNLTPPTRQDMKICRYARTFVHALNKLRLSPKDVYRSWGVSTGVDNNVITPYIVKLAQVTGLNADSLKGLDIDDYEASHPFTRRPCLRYWKERSTGEKVLHLDLAHAEITWLTAGQSVEVAKIFKSVGELTKNIRLEGPDAISNKLFIWKSTGAREYGAIKSLATAGPSIVSRLLSDYAKSKGLLTDEGKPLSLSASRLRPSFISELVDKGVTIREIQIIMGHANLRTTAAYMDRLDFNRFARIKLNDALTSLHSTAVEQVESSRLIAMVDIVENTTPPIDRNIYGVVFKTPLADCRNILNPPDFVKRLSAYVPGTPCSMYNKCLSCDNSLITVAHLPQLFALYRDYSRLTQVSRVMDTPYGRVVHENMQILESMLNRETSSFSEEELEAAKRLSDYIESTVLVDGVGL